MKLMKYTSLCYKNELYVTTWTDRVVKSYTKIEFIQEPHTKLTLYWVSTDDVATKQGEIVFYVLQGCTSIYQKIATVVGIYWQFLSCTPPHFSTEELVE